ncbi:MAG: coproporphyrinogen-III oxidase family protein [Gammaproteobacteria bacterium]
MQISNLDRIASALQSTPTAAYSAPHDYPHAAPLFEPCPSAEREHVDSDYLRLYIHIPFCNYACSFCCYAKRVGAKREVMERYVSALKKELDWVKPGTLLTQFFMGGGTPTALPADLLDEVLAAICSRMSYYGNFVHTVEASPESVSDEHLQVLRKRGVGRISMGIQSLQEEVLDSVARSHGAQLALEACRRIIGAGFILNADLMYGLPNQTEASFREDFERAAENGVHAVTAYNLRLNEFTPVAKRLTANERFDLGSLLRWRAFVRDTAQSLGYSQTRWHTFKKLDSVAARHERLPTADENMKGYQFGIGLSARSSLNHIVYRNHRNIKPYIERVEAGDSPVEEVIRLKTEDLKTQFIARTLGDGKGLRLDEYAETFGNSLLEDFEGVIQRLLKGGLIDADDSHVAMTETGKLVYDLVMLAFYPPRAKQWLMERLQAYQLNPLTLPHTVMKG